MRLVPALNIRNAVAAAIFSAAAVVYGLTVAPSVVLWDSGEFIASAFRLQVMHPPGAPLYVLLARAFTMLSGAEHAALAVNLVSVVAASFTALLVYLIGLRLARRCTGRSVGTSEIAGSAIGALTLVVSDTFWFNAVEAEVYALATFFAAAIVWLTLRWSDRADQSDDGGHRYLVLIALLVGLSIGIHLMSMLTYLFVVPIAFFTLVDRTTWSPVERTRNLLLAALAGAIGFAVLYPGIVVKLPEMAGRVGSPWLTLLVLTAVLGAGLYITRSRPVAHVGLCCVVALLIGYSSYSIIPIRSAANPEIDLNDPETTQAFVSYLKREQYGRTPLLMGATYDAGTIDTDVEKLFPRRHSADPQHLALYAGYGSDLDYFLRYQVGHMYVRYFMWNFVGRAHDTQHARTVTGFESVDTLPYEYETPSEAASRNAYFGLPLLLGLLGLLYHVRKDWRTALSLAFLFVVMGLGLVFFLNEIPATPRERDYIYVGSFLVFCLWIGLGATAFFDAVSLWTRRRLTSSTRRAALVASISLAFTVPAWMGVQNMDDHDRSGNVAARDLAYNLLMSVEEDAILITGGDNDTYPLWYLQSVEGIRRDVRIVCIPLAQAPWYALQLKHQRALDAAPVPFSLTDDELRSLRPVAWQARDIALPVDAVRLLEQPALQTAVEDTNGFESPMRWHLEGRPFDHALSYLTVADQVLLDMLATNARNGWTRPIYFGMNTGPADRLNLEPYLQREGLAYRVVPIRHTRQNGRVVSSIMADRLDRFQLTNLSNPEVYYAADVRSIAGFNYRLSFAQAADTLVDEGALSEAAQRLATVMAEVPTDTIPLHPFQAVTLGRAYLRLGSPDDVVSVVESATARVIRGLRVSGAGMEAQLQLAQAMRGLLFEAQAFDEASAFSGQLASVLGDESLRRSPTELRALYHRVRPGG